MELNNSALRKKAITLYKEHWKVLTLASFLTALQMYLITAISNAVAVMPVLQQIIIFVLNVIVYPVTTIGSAYLYLEIWRGNVPKISMLFKFCSSINIWLKALSLGVFYGLITDILTIPGNLYKWKPDNLGMIFISFIFILINCWVMLRFVLAQYLYCDEYLSQSAVMILKESFMLMKGKMWRYIRLMISVIIWIVLVMFTLAIIWVSVIGNKSVNVFIPIFGAILSLLMPYPLLASTGFAHDSILKRKMKGKNVV